MLVHVSKLLGRMTGIPVLEGLEITEHSPLSNPLLSVKVLTLADEQEQEQIAADYECYSKTKGSSK